MGDSRYKDNLTTFAKRLRPLLLSIAEGAMNANEWDNIILIVADGGGTSYYDPDATGFAAAIVAAGTGDVIYVPPATITGNHTIPAGVEIWGAGRDKTIFSGQITLSSDSVINNLSVIRSFSAATLTVQKGVIGTSSGTSYVYDCVINLSATKQVPLYAVDQPAGGTTKIWESDIQALQDGNTTNVGRKNMHCYAIHVTHDGEVVHRFCNIRATQNSTDQRNPFYDDTGSVFTTGSTVGTGSFDVDAEAGSSVGGLTIGNWYSLENTGGPWTDGGGGSQYGWCISFDDGTTWDVIEELISGGTRVIYLPPACEHTEAEATNYARTFFKATATSIKIRVADAAGEFADNGGSMGYTLKNLTIELDATQAYASDIIDPLGATVPVPHLGDRSAYDVDDYDTKHASDIYNDVLLRHLPSPVGEDDNDIAYVDTNKWLVGSAADAGIGVDDEKVGVSANDTTPGYLNGKLVAGTNITLTEGTDGGDETFTIDAAGGEADPTDAYWEPAVVAGGDEILFTSDGDVAMVWID